MCVGGGGYRLSTMGRVGGGVGSVPWGEWGRLSTMGRVGWNRLSSTGYPESSDGV